LSTGSGGIDTLRDFLEDYPSVSASDAKAIIDKIEQQHLANRPVA